MLVNNGGPGDFSMDPMSQEIFRHMHDMHVFSAISLTKVRLQNWLCVLLIPIPFPVSSGFLINIIK